MRSSADIALARFDGATLCPFAGRLGGRFDVDGGLAPGRLLFDSKGLMIFGTWLTVHRSWRCRREEHPNERAGQDDEAERDEHA